MEGSVVNFKGKSEKNKKIKAGRCLFPFKYKGQTYTMCLDTPSGKICATEINPKNGILTKYGYCPTDQSPTSFKKSTVKKARKPYTRKQTVRMKTPSPIRAKTPSPIRAKTPSPIRAKTPSPPLRRTIKLKKNLKYKDKKPLTITMPNAVEPNAIKEKRWNTEFIQILEELADIMQRQGEPFKARAYQKAQETIMTYEKDIHSVEEIKNLPGIGKTIESKLF